VGAAAIEAQFPKYGNQAPDGGLLKYGSALKRSIHGRRDAGRQITCERDDFRTVDAGRESWRKLDSGQRHPPEQPCYYEVRGVPEFALAESKTGRCYRKILFGLSAKFLKIADVLHAQRPEHPH
jgi:hypothetical protein